MFHICRISANSLQKLNVSQEDATHRMEENEERRIYQTITLPSTVRTSPEERLLKLCYVREEQQGTPFYGVCTLSEMGAVSQRENKR